MIISVGMLAAALISLFISFVFKEISPRDIIIFCVCFKFVMMILLILMFQKPVNHIILFTIFMLDTISGQLIIFAIYPVLTRFVKNNKLYSKRKLIEYLMQDIGLAVEC